MNHFEKTEEIIDSLRESIVELNRMVNTFDLNRKELVLALIKSKDLINEAIVHFDIDYSEMEF